MLTDSSCAAYQCMCLAESCQSTAKLAQPHDLTAACIYLVWEISCRLYCCTARYVRSQHGLLCGQNTYNMLLQADAAVTLECHLRVVHAPDQSAHQDSFTSLQAAAFVCLELSGGCVQDPTNRHSLIHLPTAVRQVLGSCHVMICLGPIHCPIGHTQGQIPRQVAGKVFKSGHEHCVLLNEAHIQETTNADVHQLGHHFIHAVLPHAAIHFVLHGTASLMLRVFKLCLIAKRLSEFRNVTPTPEI